MTTLTVHEMPRNNLAPIDVTVRGAVVLGPHVVCDGYRDVSAVRVQTHVHLDHLADFNKSKGFQDIVSSGATRDLLVAYLNEDLVYRKNGNLKALEPSDELQIEDCTLEIVPNEHMLGSVGAVVTLGDGRALGYSGDFSWPQARVMQVDALVLDATYGSPESIRQYSQGDAEEAFLHLIQESLRAGPVFVTAFRGTVERALDLVSENVDCEMICSSKLAQEVGVYRNYGYTIGRLWSVEEAAQNGVLDGGRYLRFFSTGDQRPVDREGVTVVKLSAFGLRSRGPVATFSEKSHVVGLSNHADFNGTIEFVRSTGAQFVVTDNTRGGHAVDLAIEIRRRLGVEAWPSSNRREIKPGMEGEAQWSF